VIYAALILLPAAQLFRDWRYHDRRTRRHHAITRILLASWLVAGLASSYLYWREARQTSRLESRLDQILSGNETLLSQNTDQVSKAESLEGQNRELLLKAETLGQNNERLLQSISQYQQEIRSKDSRIAELERKANMAARGVFDRYDFNGAHRIVSGGDISVDVGKETETFQAIMKLEADRNYPELAQVCKAQIALTPDWLTPYLFLGIAYANTGEREKSIEMLQHVRRKAPGDPEYLRAEEFLTRLGAQ